MYKRILSKSYILVIVSFLILHISSCTLNEGGVTVSNNMERYALDYIKENELLNEGEKIVAYYDYTISLDGTEAVLLTNDRLIYHNQETSNSYIKLENIIDIDHRTESLNGDVIEVTSEDGDFMVVEIAPLNGGKTFIKLLRSKVADAAIPDTSSVNRIKEPI